MNSSIFTRNVCRNEEFLKKALPYNRIILCAGTSVAVIIELMNMFRVLFFTDAKLTTLNNRIYFGFYLAYFIFAGLFLIVEFFIKLTPVVRHRLYMFSASVMLLWHTVFNGYDVYRTSLQQSPVPGTITITAALLIFSALLIMHPIYTLSNLLISCGGFILFLFFCIGDSGLVINFSITALLCIVIYLARYRHFHIEMLQDRKLKELQQELSETQRDFRLSIEQYELIHEQGSYVTFEWNLRDDSILFSKEWKELFGESEIITHFTDAIRKKNGISEEHKQVLFDCLEQIRAGVPFQKYDLLLPVKSGEERWFELRVISQKTKNDKPFLGVGTLSDITDRKEKIIQLEQDLQRDLFTGLLNKKAIEHYGEKKLKSLGKDEVLHSLLLDIDDFKDVNDTYGHPVGDRVLKQVAELIRDTVPMRARAGRIGGDEFLVLLPTSEVISFETYAEVLRLRVSRIRLKDLDVKVTCSIGLSSADSNTISYSELYGKTDDAVYLAKQKGKNQVCRID